MGIAASQCRLLLLTARKSDLELRAQMITQRKILLATQQEEIANNYTLALRNRMLKWTIDFNGNSNNATYELMTYDGINTPNATHEGSTYRVEDCYGNLVVKDYSYDKATGEASSSDPAVASLLTMDLKLAVAKDASGNTLAVYLAGNQGGGSETETSEGKISGRPTAATATDKDKVYAGDGKTDVTKQIDHWEYVTASVQVSVGKPNEDGSFRIEALDASKIQYNGQQILGVNKDGKPDTSIISGIAGANENNGRNMVAYGDVLDNNSWFQNALRKGTLLLSEGKITNADANVAYTLTKHTPIAFGALSGTKDALYSEDDAEAQAIYETEMAKVQTQDKIYDTELKQVETQQKAAETEIDGIKSLLKGNIEKSFKIFSNS